MFDSQENETEPYSVILSTGLHTVTLDSKLYPKGTNPYGEDSDTDDDGKYDWDEINWNYVEEYWKEEGLPLLAERTSVEMNDMPTISFCMHYEVTHGAFYVGNAFERFITYSGFTGF